ncbi:hypothetical protein EDD15DRAFT_2211944 [Pisolithus albus]|nr:hypothetical protein EDD15DRAFT_2211944 [Pisolithus albus]
MQSLPTAVSTPNPYSSGLKRARSPGPASPSTERQVKRIALAFANGGDVTSVLNVNRRASFVASDVSNPCHFPLPLSSPASGHQDDWVQQAKDLAICETDINVPSGSALDESMVIDAQPHPHPYSSAPTSSIAPLAGHPPAIYFSPATPSSETPTPPSHDYGFREQDHDFCVGSHHHHHQHGTTNAVERTSTLRTESIPMGKSCFPPSPCLSGSSRKQRFTMGPRVDCIKCRMGVKGHWVHLD